MPAGRPPVFKKPEDMQKAVDEYFAECEKKEKPPLVSGLAFHLGISTEALRNYEGKEEFLATVKRAKQRIEIALEENLHGNAVTGTIFNLKNNFGWKDKTETEGTQTVTVKYEDESV